MKNCEYDDFFCHFRESDTEAKEEIIGFPFTRYANVLNRPKVVDHPGKSKNSEFALYAMESGEMDEGEAYELFNAVW